MRKRAVLTLLTGTIVGLAVGSRVVAEPLSRLDRILETGRLRVGTTGDFKPMTFKDPVSGDFVGFDIDVVRQLARDMEVEPEFVLADWRTLVSGLVADKYDLTTSASMTVGRAKQAAFSKPFVEFGTVPIILRTNRGRFPDWAGIDLPGVTVAVMLGTVFEEQAHAYFPRATIQAIEGPARDFQEVLSGHALVSLTSNVEAAALAQTYPELAIVEMEAPRAVRPGAFLLERNDQVWINFVDAWVRMNEASGLFAALQQKWGLR